MAKRIFQNSNWTPTATADASTLANATYMALKGGSGTQLNRVSEIFAGGLAGSSAPTALSFARSSTLATTPTALAAPASDGPMKAASAALAAPPVTFTAAATGGQRSAATSDAHLHLAFNAFGSLVRWQAPPDGEFELLGNTTPLGEAYLSSQNIAGAGLIDAHIIYEPL
jgi:hypothetical protein